MCLTVRGVGLRPSGEGDRLGSVDLRSDLVSVSRRPQCLEDGAWRGHPTDGRFATARLRLRALVGCCKPSGRQVAWRRTVGPRCIGESAHQLPPACGVTRARYLMRNPRNRVRVDEPDSRARRQGRRAGRRRAQGRADPLRRALVDAGRPPSRGPNDVRAALHGRARPRHRDRLPRPAGVPAAALQYIEILAEYDPMFCGEPVAPGETDALRV
jgi:hypothetical protein